MDKEQFCGSLFRCDILNNEHDSHTVRNDRE